MKIYYNLRTVDWYIRLHFRSRSYKFDLTRISFYCIISAYTLFLNLYGILAYLFSAFADLKISKRSILY